MVKITRNQGKLFKIGQIVKFPLLIMIIFSIFLGLFFFSELQLIEKEYNSSNPYIHFMSTNIVNSDLETENTTISYEFDQINSILGTTEIKLLHVSNSIKWIPHFDWTLGQDINELFTDGFPFNFMFVENNDQFLFNSTNNASGLKIEEGDFPMEENEVLVDSKFKNLGYDVGSEIKFGYFDSNEFEPPHRIFFDYDYDFVTNVSFYISGFYGISNPQIIDNTMEHYTCFFGSSSLKEQILESKNGNQSQVPYFSSILMGIQRNITESKKISMIIQDIDTINSWILNFNSNFSFNFTSISNVIQYSITFSQYTGDVLDLNKIKSNGYFSFISYQINAFQSLKMEMGIIIIPFFIIFNSILLLIIINSLDFNQDKIKILFFQGMDEKKIKNIIVNHCLIRLSIAFFLILLLFTAILHFSTIGSIIFESSILLLSLSIMCEILISYIMISLKSNEKIKEILSYEYYEMNEEIEIEENERLKKKRKETRKLLLQLIACIAPISLFLFYWMGFTTHDSNLDDVLLPSLPILSLFVILFLPIVVSKLLYQLVKNGQTFLLKLFIFRKKNKKFLGIYQKIVKNNSKLNKTTFTLLVFTISMTFLSSFFYTSQINIFLIKNDINWDKTDLKIDLSSISMEEDVQNMILDLKNSSNIKKCFLSRWGSTIGYGDRDAIEQIQIFTIYLNSSEYLNYVGTKNLNPVIFQRLNAKENNVIVSKGLANGLDLKINDSIPLSNTWHRGERTIKDYNIIGIIESAPLLYIDQSPHSTFLICNEIEQNYIDEIHTLKFQLCLKVGENFNLPDFKSYLYRNYDHLIKNIEYKFDNSLSVPVFLERFFYFEIGLFIILWEILIWLKTKDLFKNRLNEGQILLDYGYSKSNYDAFVVKENMILIGSILFIGIILNLILSFLMFTILLMFHNMNYLLSYCCGIEEFVNQFNSSIAHLKLIFNGNPIPLKYTFDIFALLIAIITIFLTLITSKKISGNEKKW